MPEVSNPPARKLAGKCEGAGDERRTMSPMANGSPHRPTGDDINISGQSGKTKAPFLDECSMDRKMRALGIADEVRCGRAQIKRDLKAGERRFDDLMEDLPTICFKVPIGKLVQWVPGVKGEKAKTLLDGVVFSPDLPAGKLSVPTRRKIGELGQRFQNTRIRQREAQREALAA